MSACCCEFAPARGCTAAPQQHVDQHYQFQEAIKVYETVHSPAAVVVDDLAQQLAAVLEHLRHRAGLALARRVPPAVVKLTYQVGADVDGRLPGVAFGRGSVERCERAGGSGAACGAQARFRCIAPPLQPRPLAAVRVAAAAGAVAGWPGARAASCAGEAAGGARSRAAHQVSGRPSFHLTRYSTTGSSPSSDARTPSSFSTSKNSSLTTVSGVRGAAASPSDAAAASRRPDRPETRPQGALGPAAWGADRCRRATPCFGATARRAGPLARPVARAASPRSCMGPRSAAGTYVAMPSKQTASQILGAGCGERPAGAALSRQGPWAAMWGFIGVVRRCCSRLACERGLGGP